MSHSIPTKTTSNLEALRQAHEMLFNARDPLSTYLPERAIDSLNRSMHSKLEIAHQATLETIPFEIRADNVKTVIKFVKENRDIIENDNIYTWLVEARGNLEIFKYIFKFFIVIVDKLTTIKDNLLDGISASITTGALPITDEQLVPRIFIDNKFYKSAGIQKRVYLAGFTFINGIYIHGRHP